MNRHTSGQVLQGHIACNLPVAHHNNTHLQLPNFQSTIPIGHHGLLSQQPVFRQDPQLISAIPVQHSCSFCTTEIVQNITQNPIIQVPIQVNIPTGTALTANPIYGPACFPTPHKPLENELLARSELSHQYLPPLPKSGAKQKMEDDSNRTLVGMNKWFWKRKTEQQNSTVVSKNKIKRTQKALKRLNTSFSRRILRVERRQKLRDHEAIRQSKLELLQRKGIKLPTKLECSLWSCPRKQFKWKRPLTPPSSQRQRRSSSRLSNLSRRSRSPIIFQRSV